MQTPPVIVLTGATNGLGRIAALELARKGARLALVVRDQAKDALIDNAGVHTFAQRVTFEGLSEMTVVNYVAPRLLTELLREDLLAPAPAPARIVNVASRASNRAGARSPGRDEAVQRELWRATVEFLRNVRHILR